MQMFEVGGCVRDELLGVRSKDIDFSVVVDLNEIPGAAGEPITPFDFMVVKLERMGLKIIRDNDGEPVGAKHFTARGIASKDFPVHPGRALDFVLARKESDYSDGRRPDSVEVGTLMDDLSRRDFTMNAIAKAVDGSLIDPFFGTKDISHRIIRAVGDPMERLLEDALRAVRALRFSVTKQFAIDGWLRDTMRKQEIADAVENNVSDERIDIELQKMFRFDTVASLDVLHDFPLLTQAMFAGSVSLDSTLKTKGRGK